MAFNSEEVMKIWNRVRENSKKLEGCTRHDFSIDNTPEKPLLKKFKCTNCGGEVDSQYKKWYELGIEHAKKECGSSESN